MKTIACYIGLFILSTSAFSQNKITDTYEKYGNTLNAGVGIGYYRYTNQAAPVLYLNYECDLAKNVTLAPFIGYYSYQNNYYWGGPNYQYRNYAYHTTVIPVGVKASYYFDSFLKANSNWDFYLAISLGFAYRKTVWENAYYGASIVDHNNSGLYFDGHIGTEYHFNKKLGLFMDLSSGASSFGLSIHI